MPIDIGYIGLQSDDGVQIRIYYQRNFIPETGQTYRDAPLVNNADPTLGPIGYCLVVINTTGAPRRISVSNASGDLLRNILVPEGNPVTSGQARSRTVSVLNNAGFTTRGSVSELTIT